MLMSPARLKCPRCGIPMTAHGDGVYTCANGCRWLDDTCQEEEPEPENWRPAGVSLSYVPGTVKGGGSSNNGPSPAKQKYDAWVKRNMPGIHARQIRLAQPSIRLTKD